MKKYVNWNPTIQIWFYQYPAHHDLWRFQGMYTVYQRNPKDVIDPPSCPVTYIGGINNNSHSEKNIEKHTKHRFIQHWLIEKS